MRLTEPATCDTTRAALDDYLRHRLPPGRRRRLVDHVVQCVRCMRVFTDVRESAWTAATPTRAPHVRRTGRPGGPYV
ncbi:putative zinc-finger [Promicromonospora thailandica]|uniref:Zinc-finger n=2 Tax=Promicromonospora thailandica TaxID=765201 RepID=A0A9X2GBD9_9MICO|nr:putative zinc-finger [Promicromonospora thailandica]BFF17304.1 hypothetical protein GCM10025730_08250 [Promicromonospora thailandica]